MTGKRLPPGNGGAAAKSLAAAAVVLLFASCGAKIISVGSVPFPAEEPVFVDDAGNKRADLPPAPEPIRLVFIDHPWCPQCGEAWDALGAAAENIPPGAVRVYRILFDRGRRFAPDGVREVPPLRPPASPGSTPDHPGMALLEVTTLTPLPGPFQNRFRVDHAPLLLLLDRDGTVARRWNGYSPSLGASLAEEVRRISGDRSPTGK